MLKNKWILTLISVLALLTFCESKVIAFVLSDAGKIKARQKAFAYFGRWLAKKHGMKHLIAANGNAMLDSEKSLWGISLVDYRSLTKEQARTAIVPVIQDFIEKIYRDPDYSIQLKELGGWYYWFDPVLSPERIGIKLAFWDQDVNRPLAPYVCLVLVKEGKIFYYYANPKDQSLGDSSVETFEEAFQIFKQSN